MRAPVFFCELLTTIVACGLFVSPSGASPAEFTNRRYNDGAVATLANAYDFNYSQPSTVRGQVRNPLEDINIKELLETLSKLGRTVKRETVSDNKTYIPCVGIEKKNIKKK